MDIIIYIYILWKQLQDFDCLSFVPQRNFERELVGVTCVGYLS